METGQGRNWGKLILVGCLGIFALACVVIAFVLVLNWSAISGFVGEAASSLKELSVVQSVLQEKYSTPRVRVQVMKSTSETGATLYVEFENAPFLKDIDPSGPDGKSKALEIAATAREALPEERHFERYAVSFKTKQSLGIAFGSMQNYVFLEGDLPPPGSR